MVKKLIPLIFIVLLLLTACAAPAAAPTATTQATETPAPTIAPTEEPTPLTTPTPETTVNSQMLADLNQKIQNFLNQKNEFSEEIMFDSGNLFTDIEDNPLKFGIYRGDQLTVGAWLFDTFRRDENDYLIVGFDGVNNERFVTVVEFPTECMLKVGSGLTLTEFSDASGRAEIKVMPSLSDSEEIRNFFEGLKSGPVKMTFYAEPSDKDLSEYGDLEEYLKKINDRTGLVNELFNEVDNNGFANIEGLHPETIEDGTKLVRIENIEEAYTLSSEQIPPFLVAFGYIG